MKKLFNISYIALFAVLALFSACTEENEYTPANPSAATNPYKFEASTPSNVVLALTDSVYNVVVERADATEEVTLPLVAKGDLDVFTVPTTVTFAAGETTAELQIAIAPSMEAFKNYYLEVSIDENYVNPYLPDNNSVCLFTFLKEDYAPFAVGKYTAWLFGAWNAVLEYSPMLDLYRFKDCWVKGDVTFRITDPETMAFEMTAASFPTGYDYQPGAPVVANVLAKYNYFDAETNTFYFAYQMFVPALNGGFGEDFDTFQILEYAE
jgi:hypothetical protein